MISTRLRKRSARRSAEALDYVRRALQVVQAIAAKHPDDVQRKHALADAHRNLAIAQDDAGDFRGAISSLSAARQLAEAALSPVPSDRRIVRDLGGILSALATLRRRQATQTQPLISRTKVSRSRAKV